MKQLLYFTLDFSFRQFVASPPVCNVYAAGERQFGLGPPSSSKTKRVFNRLNCASYAIVGFSLWLVKQIAADAETPGDKSKNKPSSVFLPCVESLARAVGSFSDIP